MVTRKPGQKRPEPSGPESVAIPAPNGQDPREAGANAAGGKPLSNRTLELIADRFKILGDPLRLRILQGLQTGERSVSELVTATGAGQANVSRHLQILARSGIVSRRKEGLHVFYRLSDPSIIDLCEVVCDSLADQLSRKRFWSHVLQGPHEEAGSCQPLRRGFLGVASDSKV